MIEIEKPSIELVDSDENKTYGKFVLEPLERGYGTTLGNSLRRVLLSSLPGSAITSVKIDGVLHEFSTIPGVVEDVTDIVLNLKQLNLALNSDEAKVIRIDKEGEGVITAGDIIAGPEVDILNPEQVIATLDKNGKLFIEMVIERGRGYIPAVSNKKEEDSIGTIPIDAIFSPIKKVNFSVEDTRVGQKTDYDRLILEVWTRGSITPSQAISLSAKVLADHLSLFINLSESTNDIEIMIEKEEDTKDNILELTIEELDLTVRSHNCLKRAGIITVNQLTQRTEEEMMKVRNLGTKSLVEIKQKLASLGLGLKSSEE
ncbi:MAG: DNA-directed RNA polymerase subunit alpha [Eubacteriales bacterium]|jgi:DNA-directed RNA polymerase subunit alpha|nr:DNA-directed RNA polymerase subunit alpha [Bacteroidales bacterium]MDD4342934.1 DNA-directed RNA polymerase subunit alpha [Eubacteriales bacterium]NCC81092.1 DNA-directed RNA polymerase subunit alpha [Clostridia bacterium]